MNAYKVLKLGALLPLLCHVQLAAASVTTTYTNARFGFSVSYPMTLLIPQAAPANGDGMRYLDTTGTSHFNVFAAINTAGNSPAQIQRSAESPCAGSPASYHVVKPHLVAMACTHAGMIFYQKTIIENGIETSLTASYPIADRAKWDQVVTHMADSLTPAKP